MGHRQKSSIKILYLAVGGLWTSLLPSPHAFCHLLAQASSSSSQWPFTIFIQSTQARGPNQMEEETYEWRIKNKGNWTVEKPVASLRSLVSAIQWGGKCLLQSGTCSRQTLKIDMSTDERDSTSATKLIRIAELIIAVILEEIYCKKRTSLRSTK